jgi:hypothetical protein
MKKFFVAAFILVLACSATSAADKGAPVPSAAGDADTDIKIKMESRQPMNMDEPMPTGMAKKGMKKGDVKARALKKKSAMDDMMKQEKMEK